MLYRWVVGLAPDDLVWDPAAFAKDREWLQNGEVFAKLITSLPDHSQVKLRLLDEHFSVEGTPIKA